jgi:hypothetical protein
VIQRAWLWVRHQPRSILTFWFRQRVQLNGGRIRKVLIVALARKLLIAFWKYGRHLRCFQYDPDSHVARLDRKSRLNAVECLDLAHMGFAGQGLRVSSHGNLRLWHESQRLPICH